MSAAKRKRRKNKRVQCGHFRGYFTRIVSDEGTFDYATCSSCYEAIGVRYPVAAGQPYRGDWKHTDFPKHK